MDASTIVAIDALARAAQDPHLDAANRAAILAQIQRLATAIRTEEHAMPYVHKTIPASDIRPGDLLVRHAQASEVTRVQPFGSIGYGTKPGYDVYLHDAGRVTVLYGEKVTVRITG